MNQAALSLSLKWGEGNSSDDSVQRRSYKEEKRCYLDDSMSTLSKITACQS